MAFPVNGIIDSLQSAGGLSANWTSPSQGQPATVTENATGATGGAAGAVGAAYYNAATFGADCEVYMTVGSIGATSCGIVLRCTNPGGTSAPTLNFYEWSVGATGQTLYKVVNGAATSIGTSSQTVSAGDSIGMSVVGTSIQTYYKSGAGAWGALGAPVSSSSVTGTGFLGFYVAGNAFRVTNFGGGTLAATAGTSVVAPTQSPAIVAAHYPI